MSLIIPAVPQVKDFLIEVGKGNVPGHTVSAVIGRNTAVSSTLTEDVWGGGGNMVLPTAAESWEIVSTSVNDTSAGTGARTVLITTLDVNYVAQTPVEVTLNGTTPVAITGTHFRPHHLASTSGLFVLTAGSSESNEGDIVVRVASAGATRMTCKIGISKSEDSQVTVPAGFTIFALLVLITWPRNESGEVSGSIKPFGTDTARISSGQIHTYQSAFNLVFQAKFELAEKSEFVFRAKSFNDAVEVTTIQELLVVDNNFL